MDQEEYEDSEQRYSVQAPEFNSGRPNIIVEIGPGGSLTADLPEIGKYLESKNANYLGVDPFPVVGFEEKKPWSKFLQADISDVGGLDEKADEVWMRNVFKGVRGDRPREVLAKAYETLKPDGTVIFWDTYSRLGPTDVEKIKSFLEEAGFSEVNEEVEAESTHPFVSTLRKQDTGRGPRVLITAKK
jgi:hypothetical protein